MNIINSICLNLIYLCCVNYSLLGSSILYGHAFILVHSYYVIRFPTKFDEYRTSITSSISGTFFFSFAQTYFNCSLSGRPVHFLKVWLTRRQVDRKTTLHYKAKKKSFSLLCRSHIYIFIPYFYVTTKNIIS